MTLRHLTLCALAGATPLLAQDPPAENSMKIEIPGVQKLRIGGQYRLRYENLFNYDFDSDATDNNDFFGQRVRIDFDFTINDRFGAFVQVQDVRYFGETMTTIGRMSPGLDLHQAYFRVNDFPGIGGDARIGRQELAYGEHRLIGNLDWANQARVFDGGRFRWTCEEGGTFDLFAVQLREDRVVINRADDAWLFGGYLTKKVDATTFDVYVLGMHDEMTGTGGNENRFTFGARADTTVDQFQFGAELATQVGKVNDLDIPFWDTCAAHAHARYNFDGERAPYVQADFDLASGDDPSSADNERFNTLFPTAHRHLGLMDMAFWENVTHGSLSFGMKPCAQSQLEASWRFFRSMESTDRVAGPNGVLSNGGAGIDEDLGQEIDLRFTWKPETEPAKTSVQVGYGLFLPGDGVQDSRGSDDLAHFFYLQGDVRF